MDDLKQIKHTPGPWITRRKTKHWSVFTGSGSYLIEGQLDRPKEADALLIAAAPDLLEACKVMHKMLVDRDCGGLAGVILGENAIAKAEGK